MTGSGRTKEAYFRGRKLVGTDIALPDSHEGVVMQHVTETRSLHNGVDTTDLDKEDENEESNATHGLQILSRFEGIVVWDQDPPKADSEDPYARSLDEWLKTANQVRVMKTLASCYWYNA